MVSPTVSLCQGQMAKANPIGAVSVLSGSRLSDALSVTPPDWPSLLSNPKACISADPVYFTKTNTSGQTKVQLTQPWTRRSGLPAMLAVAEHAVSLVWDSLSGGFGNSCSNAT